MKSLQLKIDKLQNTGAQKESGNIKQSLAKTLQCYLQLLKYNHLQVVN